MTVTRTVFKGASWLALFKFISQLFSWVVTIIVARLLLPDDYALSAMATLISSYAELFAGLGLAHSIIHQKKLGDSELSSVFWFALGVSTVFAISCWPFSYITAYIFQNNQVIPLTQATSVIFLLSGLQIVPLSLIRKNLRFKTIGLMEMTSTIISCIGMVIIAKMGGGAWALIGGRIIRSLVAAILVYRVSDWRPNIHFNYSEAKHHLTFGVTVAFGGTLFYLYEASDRFFAGRAWSVTDLGYYLFALQLSMMPTDKVVTLLNQVSFPAFAKLKDDAKELKQFYLKVIKITALIVFPLFIGGFLIGEDLIKLLLDEKWYPMIHLFEFLCLAQIITALTSLNNQLFIARGMPRMALYFDGLLALTMPLSFYIAINYSEGINSILYPWFTTYFIVSIGWTLLTLNNLGISISEYVSNIATTIIGTMLIILSVLSLKAFANEFITNTLISFSLITIIPGVIYVGYYWIYDKPLIDKIRSIRNV